MYFKEIIFSIHKFVPIFVKTTAKTINKIFTKLTEVITPNLTELNT